MVSEQEISPTETARRLKVGLDYVYKMIAAAQLPARKVNGRWRVLRQAVEARKKRLAENAENQTQ